jgi:hypothetical protein
MDKAVEKLPATGQPDQSNDLVFDQDGFRGRVEVEIDRGIC